MRYLRGSVCFSYETIAAVRIDGKCVAQYLDYDEPIRFRVAGQKRADHRPSSELSYRFEMWRETRNVHNIVQFASDLARGAREEPSIAVQ